MAKKIIDNDLRAIYKELKAINPHGSHKYSEDSEYYQDSEDTEDFEDSESESFIDEIDKKSYSEYTNRITTEYAAPNSIPANYLTSSAYNEALRKKVVNFVIFPISILGLIWAIFGYADGFVSYRRNYRPRQASEAVDMFRHGRYADSSACFSRVYDSLNMVDEDFHIVADEMSSYYRRRFRIYFRLPTTFDVPAVASDDYRLPDFVKEEVYNVATIKASYDLKEFPLEKRVSFYRMLGNYRDSEDKYKFWIKNYISSLLEIKEYDEARKLFNTLKDKELIAYFEKKVYMDKYELANQNMQSGNYTVAVGMLKELAENDVEDSKELLSALNQDNIYRTGIHINHYLLKESDVRSRNSTENKNMINARQSASDFLEKQYGLKRFQMPAFCKGKIKELADKEFEKGDYLAAYNDYVLARRKLENEEIASEPRIIECLAMLASEPRKVGSVVVLGHYEQDGNFENGPEPIEWYIVAISENKALLLSKYVLEMKKMHSVIEAVEWDSTDLRKWLNETFYNMAFNEDEKKQLQQIELSKRGFRNRSIYGLSDFENPFLFRLLGASDYEAPESIKDFVICPDSDDLKMLAENLNTAAYSTPYATAVNCNAYLVDGKADDANINEGKKGIFNVIATWTHIASDTDIKEKNGLRRKLFSRVSSMQSKNSDNASGSIKFSKTKSAGSLNRRKLNISNIFGEDIPNASETRGFKDEAKYYDACGYWLRSWTSLVANSKTYFAYYDDYGLRETALTTSYRGIRPEIMIILSDDEALPKKKGRFDDLEQSLKKLESLKKLNETLKKDFMKGSNKKSKRF